MHLKGVVKSHVYGDTVHFLDIMVSEQIKKQNKKTHANAVTKRKEETKQAKAIFS